MCLMIEKQNLNDFATRLISESFNKCTSTIKCLEVLVPKDAIKVALSCLLELKNFNAREKKNFMIAKVINN